MKKLSLVLSALLVAFVGCGETKIINGGGDDGLTGTGNNADYNHKINRTNDSKISDDIFKKIRKATVKINVSKSNNGYGWGSGFFINDEGYMVTNNHVVAGFNELRVGINGEDRLVYAELTGYDECADIAVLKLTSNTKSPSYKQNTTYLTWQNNHVNFGDHVSVAGFPNYSVNNKNEPMFTYNEGIVNTDTYQGDTRWASTETFTHSAFTTAGNSGGAVMNTNTGEVVGIHYAGNTEIEGVKYAISGVEAKEIVDKIITEGNVLSIGITPKIYQHSDGTYLGVLVDEINPGERAYNIDIRQHDIITKLKGGNLQYDNEEPRRVETLDKYCGILRSNQPHKSTIPITIQRYTVNNRWVTCEGAINGDALTLKDDKSTPCPNSGTLKFNNGLIINTPSSILNPYTTPDDTSTDSSPVIIKKVSKKNNILIHRHYPSGLCKSDYWKDAFIEQGFINPIFKEETKTVYCSTYGKQNDDKECSIKYYKDNHSDTTCVIGYDGYNTSRSRSINTDSNQFDLMHTMMNDI